MVYLCNLHSHFFSPSLKSTSRSILAVYLWLAHHFWTSRGILVGSYVPRYLWVLPQRRRFLCILSYANVHDLLCANHFTVCCGCNDKPSKYLTLQNLSRHHTSKQTLVSKCSVIYIKVGKGLGKSKRRALSLGLGWMGCSERASWRKLTFRLWLKEWEKGKGHVWKVCFRYRKQQGQTLWVYIIIIAHMYWALTFLHGTILNNIYTFPFIMTLWNIVSSFYKWELSHREFKKLAHGHWASNWRS